jgi:colicin import membrane protein
MTHTSKLTLAVLPLMLSMACTDANKAPAEAAVAAAEKAGTAITEQVERFAPEETRAFRDGLASAKASLAKQDYKTARASAESLPAKVNQAVAAAAAKQEALAREAAKAAEEAKKAYADSAAALAKQLEGLKKHVSTLSKAKKLPQGVTKATVAKAREALAAIEKGVEKAKARAASDAAAAATEVKELGQKAVELAESLKMKLR